MAGQMVEITGNTFPVRKHLRALGGTWNKPRQCWLVPVGNAERARRIVGQMEDVAACRSVPVPAKAEVKPVRKSHDGRYCFHNPVPEDEADVGSIEFEVRSDGSVWTRDIWCNGTVHDWWPHTAEQGRLIWRRLQKEGWTLATFYTVEEWARINADEDRREAKKEAMARSWETGRPPVGSWAEIAREMARNDSSGFDWDSWKDQMKEAGI